MHYGMKAKNPMDRVLFYKKEKEDETFLIPKEKVTTSRLLNSVIMTCLCYCSASLLQVSPVLPESFQERRIRVYVKKTENTKAAKL